MKKLIILSMSILLNLILISEQYPTLYIHGHKSSGTYMEGYLTWNDTIDSIRTHQPLYLIDSLENYDDYHFGFPVNCNKYTNLVVQSDKKVMFNFSYYDELRTTPGVISISPESVLIYCKHNILGDYFVAPFMDGYNNEEIDSAVYYPRYIFGYSYDLITKKYSITQRMRNYKLYWRSNRYAENLCKFIDKVLASTGASKVNLVCHSMGGLVARAAVIGYGYGDKINRIVTFGTPHKPFQVLSQEMEYKMLHDNLDFIIEWKMETDKDWMFDGELAEMDVDCSKEPFEGTVFMDLKTGSEDDWGDLLGYKVNCQLSTFAGIRAGLLTSLYDKNDGSIFAERAILDDSLTVYSGEIFASHGIGFWNNNEGIPEYGLCTSSFTTEFIKHWLIDDEEIEFNGEITDYRFGLVGGTSNPSSTSLRFIVKGTDDFGNLLPSYAGLLCATVTTFDKHNNSVDDVGPTKGIDFTNIINNERIPDHLRGSPIYMFDCEFDAGITGTRYYPKAYFYDMNGLIEVPEVSNDYYFDLENVQAPYVNLLPNATALTVFTALNTYNIDWISNDISVRNRLWYARYGSVEIIDSMIPGSSMSKSFRIPPLRSSKSHGVTEYNLINMNLRFELDDNGYFCQDNKWLTISTPDWNPDNLRLVYQDEDSIKLAWTDNYNLVDRIMRTNDNPDFERDVSTNTYSDMGFFRGVNNCYEVHSRWVYPNGEILISENDNNTHKLTVYGIPCNAPKAYPIACIWQPNDKALIKWIDNSRHEEGYRIKIKEDSNLIWQKDTMIDEAEDPDTLEWMHQTTRTGQMKYIVYSMNSGAFSKDSVEYINYRGYGTPLVSTDSIELSKGTVRIKGDTILTGTRRKLNGDIISIEAYKEGFENKILKSEFIKDDNAQIIGIKNSDMYAGINGSSTNSDSIIWIYVKEGNRYTKKYIEDLLYSPVDLTNQRPEILSAIYKNNYIHLLVSFKSLNVATKSVLVLFRIDNNCNYMAYRSIQSLKGILDFKGTLEGKGSNEIVIGYSGKDESSGKTTGLNIVSTGTASYATITTYSPYANTSFNKSFEENFDLEMLTDSILYLVSHKTGSSLDTLKVVKYDMKNKRQVLIDIINKSSSIVTDYYQCQRIAKYRDYVIASWLNQEESEFSRVYTKKYALAEMSGLEMIKESETYEDLITDYMILPNENGNELEIVTEEMNNDYEVYRLKRSDYNLPVMKIIMNDELSWYKNGTFTVKVTDGNGLKLSSAKVLVTNGADINFEGTTDVNGEVIVPYFTRSSNKITIKAVKAFYGDCVKVCDVKTNTMEVNCVKEVSAFKDTTIEIGVYTYTTGLEDFIQKVAVPSAEVVLSNGINIAETLVTGINGKVLSEVNGRDTIEWLGRDCYVDYTKEIEVTVSKEGYRTETVKIRKEMRSNSSCATGYNNSNHVIKRDELNLYMAYGDGDSVVFGRSNNFGEWWMLEKVGEGKNPSVAFAGEGTVAMLYTGNDNLGYYYTYTESPFQPIDTVYPTLITYEPGVIAGNVLTGKVYVAGIEHPLEGLEYGNLLYAEFVFDNLDGIVRKTLVPATLEEYKPKSWQSIATYYDKYMKKYYPIVVYGDIYGEINLVKYDGINGIWMPPVGVTQTSEESKESYISSNGEKTAVIWSEERTTDSNTWDIWLNGELYKTSGTESYTEPKIKSGNYVAYNESKERIGLDLYGLNYIGADIRTSGEDSVYYPDFEFKTEYNKTGLELNHTMYLMWTEKTRSAYTVKDTIIEVKTIGDLQPFIAGEFTDTITEVDDSPLADIINDRREKIERLYMEIGEIESDKEYKLTVTTTNPNKNYPYLLMIDGIAIDTIDKEDETSEVYLTEDMKSDNTILITLDRVKGNPNRVAQMEIRKYDEVTNVSILGSAIVKMITEKKGIKEHVKIKTMSKGLIEMTIEGDCGGNLEMEIYDVAGRRTMKETFKNLQNGYNEIILNANELSGGVYFYRLNTKSNQYKGKIVLIK
ncbi:MAG: alpha/beta fold hydrolase [bacterium]|nr:alpha/beta fold hydrolase [bacterium]